MALLNLPTGDTNRVPSRRSLLKRTSTSDNSNKSQNWNDFHQQYHSQHFHYSAKNEDLLLRGQKQQRRRSMQMCEAVPQRSSLQLQQSQQSSFFIKGGSSKPKKRWSLFRLGRN